VPSNLARHIVDELMKYGDVRRGTMGYIGVEKLTPELARELGMNSTAGALVARISQTSEAYRAGLQPGDVIVEFNGQPVDDPSQLSRMVMDAKIGTTATLKVLRDGRTIAVKVPIVSSARKR